MNSVAGQGDVLVCGAAGAVGSLLQRLLEGTGTAHVIGVDVRRTAPADRQEIADLSSPDELWRRRLGNVGVLVLALPESTAIAAARWMVPCLPAGALVVETLSVKTRIAALFAEARDDVELLGINPLFAPDLDPRGRGVFSVPYRAGARAAAFEALIGSAGCVLQTLSAAEHDRACAELQALTHAAVLAFGVAMQRPRLVTDERLLPPPHRLLLALLARIVSGASEVYRDIQESNPHAAPVRARLAAGVAALAGQASTEQGFRELLLELRDLFLGEEARYAEYCASAFAVPLPPRQGDDGRETPCVSV